MYGASSAIFPPVQRMSLDRGFVSVMNGLSAMTPLKSSVASGLGGAVVRVKYANESAPP